MENLFPLVRPADRCLLKAQSKLATARHQIPDKFKHTPARAAITEALLHVQKARNQLVKLLTLWPTHAPPAP